MTRRLFRWQAGQCRFVQWTQRAAAAVGFLFFAVTATPWVTDYVGQALSGAWNEPQGDVMIVLGGGSLEDGTVGESSYWRAVYAARLWRRHPFQKILFCGAAAAAPMREFAGALGVPAHRMEITERSTSTREDVQEAKRWLDRLPAPPHGVLLLSSDFHMHRSVRLFRKAGVTVIGHPVSDVRKRARRWASRWPAFLDSMLEIGKIGYYQSRGWI
jgi:uncharacterized SAM-binding protein YcdF (DUF218 family)